MLMIFDGDDDAYQQWLKENPHGYVTNARRNMAPSYRVLHRASCRTIRDYTGQMHNGAFTERSYIKICAPEIEELRDWLSTTGRPDGTFSKECSLCSN